jgi:hypothetical protein
LIAINRELKTNFELSPAREWKTVKGCLRAHPLRYGDIESDGVNELLLTLDNNIVLFSPVEKKVIFSAHYWLSDEIDQKRAEATFSIIDASDTPQFLSESGTEPAIGRMYPAWRSLTKIFSDEFNDMPGHDLLIWRKVYDSNLNKELPGFTKTADVFFHYSKEGGSYLLKETEQETMLEWLNDKNLTWSKGYPSTSECPGEEGQLILEMHDPLLNDPDVLN